METVKVVYNDCYGGFFLSQEALDLYEEMTGERIVDEDSLSRTNKILVYIVEKLGSKASGESSNLQLHELPKGTRYYISEYDGLETVCIYRDNMYCVAEYT